MTDRSYSFDRALRGREPRHLKCNKCGAVGFSKEGQRCIAKTGGKECGGTAIWSS